MTSFRILLLVIGNVCIVQACYKSGWSRWINDYKPSTKLFPQEAREGIPSGGGDIENMNQTERNQFCVPGHGTIINVECASDAGVSYNETGQTHLECSVAKGFKCSNRLFAGMCLDYKIRLYCQCNTPLPSTTSTVLGHVPGGKTGGIHTAGGQVTSANTKEGRTTDKAQVPHVGPDGSRTTVSGQVSNSSLPDTRTSASGPVSQVNQQGKRTSQGSPDGHHSTVSVRDGNGSQNNDGATNKPGATVGALGHDSSNPGNGGGRSDHWGVCGMTILSLALFLLTAE